MAATVKDLDDRIDALVAKLDATSLSTETFKAKAETAFTFAKWGVTLIGGAVLAGLLQLYAVANQAGQLQNSVAEIREGIRKQDAVVIELGRAVHKQEVATTELQAAVKSQHGAVTELKMVVKSLQESVTELKAVVQELRSAVQRQEAATAKQTQLLEAIAKDLAELKPKSKP